MRQCLLERHSAFGLMTGAIVDYDQSVRGAYDAPPAPPEKLFELRAAE